MKGFIMDQYLELLRWGAYAAIACAIMTALGLLWLNIRLDTIERDLRDIHREMFQQRPSQQPPIYP